MSALVLLLSITNAALLNGGPLQQMGTGPLSTEALSMLPGLLEAVQYDDNTAVLIHHLVECALGPDQSVTLPTQPEPVTFEGGIGLAPEWAEGPCDEACQEWVTSCMLARTNAYGIPVFIDLHVPMPSVLDNTATDRARYPVEEGAFYGNLFVDPPREYACRGDGDDAISLTFRACTLPGSRCGIQVVGRCDDLCEGVDDAHGGARTLCHTRPREGGDWPTRPYARVMTTFLRRSSLQPADDALPCETAPERPFEVPEVGRATAPVAGAPCDNDDDCSDGTMVCDARIPGGMCTTACTPSLDRAEEAAACGGPGTTCLLGPAGAYCTRTCRPGEGECGAGRMCTGSWFLQPNGRPDAPGCLSFCSSDADCPPAVHCNTRLGQCGPFIPDDARRLPDGEPCTLDRFGNTPADASCRGLCVRVGPDPSQGICASLVNTAVTPACPDERTRLIHPSGDELGLCVFRLCDDSADCTPPLRCIGNVRLGQTPQCEYRPE